MASSCEHVAGLTAMDFHPPGTSDACRECRIEDTRWVVLRECKPYGHVGCCESSPRRHATRHCRETAHSGMRSVIRGDTRDCCYVHEVMGSIDRAPTAGQ